MVLGRDDRRRPSTLFRVCAKPPAQCQASTADPRWSLISRFSPLNPGQGSPGTMPPFLSLFTRHAPFRASASSRRRLGWNDSCQVEGPMGPSAALVEGGTSHSVCCIHLRWNDSCQVEGSLGPSALRRNDSCQVEGQNRAFGRFSRRGHESFCSLIRLRRNALKHATGSYRTKGRYLFDGNPASTPILRDSSIILAFSQRMWPMAWSLLSSSS